MRFVLLLVYNLVISATTKLKWITSHIYKIWVIYDMIQNVYRYLALRCTNYSSLKCNCYNMYTLLPWHNITHLDLQVSRRVLRLRSKMSSMLGLLHRWSLLFVASRQHRLLHVSSPWLFHLGSCFQPLSPSELSLIVVSLLRCCRLAIVVNEIRRKYRSSNINGLWEHVKSHCALWSVWNASEKLCGLAPRGYHKHLFEVCIHQLSYTLYLFWLIYFVIYFGILSKQ